jgi:ketosteroid isomerase-like protein
MRTAIVGLAIYGLMAANAGAQAPPADLIAPIQQFMDAFNKGDMAGAAATHAADADTVIIDEVAPFAWHGPDAFKAWAAALDEDSKKQGLSAQKVTIGAPSRTELAGELAYVVVPAVYSFTKAGVAMRESAQMTFVLRKGTRGWLIHGWTWTGPRPTRAAGPKK